MTSSCSETQIASATHAASLESEEQRREGRVQTVYQPCCLRTGPHCGVGLIRNISENGLMVETDIEAAPGSEVDYFKETTQWRRARVVWREGRRIGLEHTDQPLVETPAYPYRALRIPTSLVGRLWLDGRAIEIGIGNISHRGVLAFGIPPIPPSQLVTLTIAGREFANTSLRWWADGSAGLRFERPMSLRALTELMEVASRSGSGLYYERRIRELLEVVPANDPRG